MVHTIAGNIIGRDNKNGGHQLGIGHDVSPTLNTVDRHAVAIGIDQQGGKGQANYAIEKSPTLAAESHGTPHAVCHSMGQTKTVRRLTPLEAERLQGLPDSWTDIEFNGKPAPDSKRYKALGNGMAQPCADFVIKRISDVANGKGI